MSVFHCNLDDGTSVYFVDTPGFDDTYKKDTDILREIADYLNKAYEHKILLSGIVYLHRISDTRIGGSGRRNLSMFKKLVGDDGLSNVVLASTMWSMVPDEDVAVARETELISRSEFWKFMISKGSRVFRQDRGAESAREIVQHVIACGQKRRAALAIQLAMVDQGLSLDQTEAGKEVQAELAKQQAEYERRIHAMKEEMQQAIANRDKEHQDEIQEHRRDIEKQIQANEAAVRRLHASRDEIRREMEARWESEKKSIIERYEALERERQRKIQEEEARIQAANYARERQLQAEQALVEAARREQRAEAARWEKEREQQRAERVRQEKADREQKAEEEEQRKKSEQQREEAERRREQDEQRRAEAERRREVETEERQRAVVSRKSSSSSFRDSPSPRSRSPVFYEPPRPRRPRRRHRDDYHYHYRHHRPRRQYVDVFDSFPRSHIFHNYNSMFCSRHDFGSMRIQRSSRSSWGWSSDSDASF